MEALLEPLNLSSLDSDCVNTLWADGFSTDTTRFPDDYLSYLQTIPLDNILISLKQEIVANVRNGILLNWRSLMENVNGFDFRRILCLVHYLLVTSTKDPGVENQKNAMAAVRLYFAMLSVPDPHLYAVFQSNLFGKALKLMMLPSLCKTPSPLLGKKSGNNKNHNTQSASFDCETKALVWKALKDLLQSLKLGNFCHSTNALEPIIEMLSFLARQETSTELTFDSDNHSPSSLSLDAFYGLSYMCHTRHGDVQEISRVVMKHVFDIIHGSLHKEVASKDGNILRKNAFNFVCYVVERVGSDCHRAVLILLQFLCIHCPERAESRYKLSENVYSLWLKFHEELFIKTVFLFIDLSCKNKSVAVRHFTMAMIGKFLLLNQDSLLARTKETMRKSNKTDFSSNMHKLCLIALLCRFQDVSGLVTAKALTVFSDYLEAGINNNIIRENLQCIFIRPYQNVDSFYEVPCRPFKDIYEVSKSFQANFDLDVTMLPCGRSVISELLDCVENDKIVVRKAALQCIIRLFRLNEKFMTKDVLKDIGCYCRDNGVFVRKMMVQEFTDLLMWYPSHEQLCTEWTVNILPLIVDPETKVVDKVSENIARVILENIVQESSTFTAKQRLPWALMTLISKFQLRKFFLEACGKWDKNGLRSKVSAIKSHIGMLKMYNTAAWLMLMCVAEFVPIKDALFVLNFYHKEVHNIPNVSTYLSQLVMEVIWFTWRHLAIDEKQNLEKELDMDLKLFKMPFPLISRAMDIRHGLYKEHANLPDDSKSLSVLPTWAVELIKKCEESITDMLRASSEVIEDEEAMQRFISSLGNAALICPGVIQKSTIQLLENLLFPSDNCHESIWTGDCSTEMKAGLIIALGKLSLQNEKRAQSLVNILGQLLNETDESVLKNNIMVCLTDLCIRYASLVEGLLPEMCVCLKDRQCSVRENTLVLLIKLLQEDYLKLKEELMFNLLTMLNDDDSTICAMTQTFFVDTVAKKNRKFLHSHFCHALFYYNGYKKHNKYSRVSLSGKESKTFHLLGSNNFKFRHNIYRFVLSLLDEDNRLVVLQLLCIDICKDFLQNAITLNEAGEDVLKDALVIMSYDEMRRSDKKECDDEAQLDADSEGSQLNSVKKAALSQVRKKHVTDVEVPTLYELYCKLSDLRSPLVKDVIRNLKIIEHEEKVDLKEILQGKELEKLKELELDFRRADRSDSSDSDHSHTSSESD